MRDKFNAVWLSNSSISDYIKCPRAYYLKNLYKNPKNFHRISLMNPFLALGQTVHDTLDEISKLPVENRFDEPLIDRFNKNWFKVHGARGGFKSDEEESSFKSRGTAMIQRVNNNKAPLLVKAIRLRQDIPWIWLSDSEEIILCGKIDWIQYDEKSDGLWIIDFKTGKFDEDPDSLQLPIYYLLLSKVQKRTVLGVKYWYLDRDDEPISITLPDMGKVSGELLDIGRRILLAKKLNRFICKNQSGCPVCLPYESIIAGKATLLGTNDRKQDIYIL